MWTREESTAIKNRLTFLGFKEGQLCVTVSEYREFVQHSKIGTTFEQALEVIINKSKENGTIWINL